jgi:hypothetical protein
MTQYLAIIERDEVGGYSTWAPDLPIPTPSAVGVETVTTAA